MISQFTKLDMSRVLHSILAILLALAAVIAVGAA